MERMRGGTMERSIQCSQYCNGVLQGLRSTIVLRGTTHIYIYIYTESGIQKITNPQLKLLLSPNRVRYLI